ncbi:Hypothetical predicted protein [Octopus vulgaris]|uniref:Uncharacterized protein n=1 Tax=Octopus vulgaris TaxID=6645 RepID=A0AA36AH22_OCTVU|nr:Hypothetical predicted protein [Octopus vulgaris]
MKLARILKQNLEKWDTEIQHKFNLNDCQELVLYWDGKLLPALTGIKKVDRLAILVTFQEISKAAVKKFSIHLWYLAPKTVALSIFDDNVPTEVKANIAQVMLEADNSEEEEEKNIN